MSTAVSVERSALAGGKYKAVILPARPCPKGRLCLPLPMAYKGPQCPLRQIYGASAGVLRLREHEPDRLQYRGRVTASSDNPSSISGDNPSTYL